MNANICQPVQSSYELITAKQHGQAWSDVDQDYVIDMFKKHGAVLLRGFSAELDGFIAFTDQFCSAYMPNPLPGRTYISKEDHIQTVNLGREYFPLHAERSQTPFQPDIAFFYCRLAPRSGGQTFFCDGKLLASRFPDSLKEQLMSRLLLYRATRSEEEVMILLGIKDRGQLEKTLEEQGLDKIYYYKDGKLVINFMTPVLEKTKFGEDLAFANFLLFSWYRDKNHCYPTFENGDQIPVSLCEEIAKLAGPISTVVHWEPHDLLMLDNTRVMHGRMQVENVEERDILTRFGYARFS